MKTNKSNNIDQLFRQKLNDFEFQKTKSAWLLIEYLLNKKKQRIRFFRLFSALVLIPASIIVLIYLTKSYKSSHQNIHEAIKTSSLKINNQIKTLNPTECISDINNFFDETNKTNKKLQNEKNNNVNFYNDISSPIKKNANTNNNINWVNTNYIIVPENQYIESNAYTFYEYNSKDSVIIQISPLGSLINSPYPDYAPVINADGSELYFTSRRPLNSKEKQKGLGKERIYFSKFNRNSNSWEACKLVDSPINTEEDFSSAVSLSNDGQILFLYRDDRFGNGDIYQSYLNGDKWTHPQKLPEPINSKYHESTVSLSPDGNTMYFVSNRPGGKGGLDIWYCTKNKEGSWSDAKNMGSPINTDKDEEGVFIHPDGKTLYFSSRGHKGLGGYDVFVSKFENGKWSAPINLGSSINTPNDDVYFVVDAAGKYAYYSSQREDGVGEKDICRIEFIYPDKNKPKSELTLFKGNIFDKKDKFPLDADIELIDLDKNEKITNLKSNSATGAFMMSLPAGKNYAINVNKNGYLFFSENFNIPAGDEYKEIHKDIYLDKLIVGSKIILKNIFYDYDKATLRQESIAELDKLFELLQKNPDIKVELSAHTDSRGSDAYNNKLSQERAQSCVDYLIKKGIDKSRIIAKGYGKQQPVIDDETINKMNNEAEKEAAHQQNRRTEIKIIEN